MGTWARGHSKRDDVANKGDRRRSHTTRRRGHARTRYEVTSRKGGQRQQPYGRPCATAGQYEVFVPRQWATPETIARRQILGLDLGRLLSLFLEFGSLLCSPALGTAR